MIRKRKCSRQAPGSASSNAVRVLSPKRAKGLGVSPLPADSPAAPRMGSASCSARPSSVLQLLERELCRYAAREISAGQALYALQDAVSERRGRPPEQRKGQAGSYGRVCALIVRLLSLPDDRVPGDASAGASGKVETAKKEEEQALQKQEDVCVGCAAADVWLDEVQRFLLNALSGDEEHSLAFQTVQRRECGSQTQRKRKRKRKEAADQERRQRSVDSLLQPTGSRDANEDNPSPATETRGGELNDLPRQMETLLHAIRRHTSLYAVEDAAENSVHYQTQAAFLRLAHRLGACALSSTRGALSLDLFSSDANSASIPAPFRMVARGSVEILLQILANCPPSSPAAALRATGSEALHDLLLQPLSASCLASVLSLSVPALHALLFDFSLDTEDDDVAFFGRSSLCRLTWIFRGSSNSVKSAVASLSNPTVFSGGSQAAGVFSEVQKDSSYGEDPRRHRSLLTFEAVMGQSLGLCRSLEELCCTAETIQFYGASTSFRPEPPALGHSSGLEKERETCFSKDRRSAGDQREARALGQRTSDGQGGDEDQSLAPESSERGRALVNVASSKDLSRMARAVELVRDLIVFGSGQAVPKEAALGLPLSEFERDEGGRYLVLDVDAVLGIVQHLVQTALTVFVTRMTTARSITDVAPSGRGAVRICETEACRRDDPESDREAPEVIGDERPHARLSLKQGRLDWREEEPGCLEQTEGVLCPAAPGFEKIFTAALTCAVSLVEVVGDAGVMADVDGFARLAVSLLRSAPRSLPFLLAARFSGLLSSFFERLFTTAPLLVLPLSGPCLTWTACLCDALGHPLFSGPSVGTKHLACPGDFDPTYTTRRAALVASCRSVFYAPFAQLGPPYLPVALHGNCLGGSGWVHQPKPARVLAGRDGNPWEDVGMRLLLVVWRHCCRLLAMLVDLQVSRSVSGPETLARLRGAADGLALGVLLRGLGAPAASPVLACPFPSVVASDAESLTATLHLLIASLSSFDTDASPAFLQAATTVLTRLDDILATNRRSMWFSDLCRGPRSEDGSSGGILQAPEFLGWTAGGGTRAPVVAAVERLRNCLRARWAVAHPYVSGPLVDLATCGTQATPGSGGNGGGGQQHGTSFVRVYEEAVREKLIVAAFGGGSDALEVSSAVAHSLTSSKSQIAAEQQPSTERETEGLAVEVENAEVHNVGDRSSRVFEAALENHPAERREGGGQDANGDKGFAQKDGRETRGNRGASSPTAEETDHCQTGRLQDEASRNSPVFVTGPPSPSEDDRDDEALGDTEEDEMALLFERMKEADPAWSDESGDLPCGLGDVEESD